VSANPARQALIRRVLIFAAAALVMVTLAVLFLTPLVVDPGSTVSGARRNQALYVKASDGVRLAVDVWLPQDLAAADKLPAVVRFTRSWRSVQFQSRPPLFLRVLMAFRLAPRLRDPNTPEADAFNEAGYALVIVDVRGTGASFGSRPYPWTIRERQDYGEVVDWITAQPWSNGRVGGYGTAYGGTAALFLAGAGDEAVRAVAPRFAEFDPVFQLFRPGGLLNHRFVAEWSRVTQGLDSGDFCAAFELDPGSCEEARRLIRGVKPVDADPDGVLVTEARAERKNADEGEAVGGIEFRDQVGPTGAAVRSISPYGAERVIEESEVPIHSWASWFDASTAEAALDQYQSLGNPQVVTIGPWTQGGDQEVNPFRRGQTPVPGPSRFDEVLLFFDHHLKEDDAPGKREIRYYTLGEETWKTTRNWPPQGSSPERWYFSAAGALSQAAPQDDAAADTYAVDFTATTGDYGRWRSRASGGEIRFEDRRAEDRKLLSYTTDPLDAAVELTGHPRVTLEMTNTESDGALHVYLEMVAPDSTVTLLTEGALRLAHYQARADVPPYESFGPPRSFIRDAARFVPPGDPFTVDLALLPLSVLVPPGYRLRIAVSGADAGVFERFPIQGGPVFTVFRDRERASYVDLPVVAAK